jgi:Mg-chelatase subunit ChlD
LLESPDTWEVALSAGADKKETFTRLLKEEKLGAMALLRNLRNMQESGVDNETIRQGLRTMKVERVLPFRFITAARYAPTLEPELEQAMLKCLEDHKKLPGKTVLVVDSSGSMDAKVSGKSQIMRVDAACALAMLLREICDEVQVVVFSDEAVVVPPRRGFALRDVIVRATPHGGTRTQNALDMAARQHYDRCIVITDEQSHQSIGGPIKGTKGYFINVASAKNGIGYGAWTHIDGWSEAVLEYIFQYEGFMTETLTESAETATI